MFIPLPILIWLFFCMIVFISYFGSNGFKVNIVFNLFLGLIWPVWLFIIVLLILTGNFNRFVGKNL